MKKSLIIIIVAVLVVIAGSIGGFFLYSNIENNKVASVITIDINPSIEIHLNKKDEVIKMVALNHDAEKIVDFDYKNKSLNETITKLSEKVVLNGYAKDGKVSVLISSDNKEKVSLVKNEINSSFEKINVSAEVIVSEITDSAKNAAKELNISESKASFIESIIKDNENLTVEELKDKSIEELESIKINTVTEPEKEEEPVVEPTIPDEEEEDEEPRKGDLEEDKNKSTTNKSGTTTKKPTQTIAAPTTPIDPNWCKFNTTKAAETYEYPKVDYFFAPEELIKSVGEKYKTDGGNVISSGGKGLADARCSYCSCSKVWAVTTTKRYTGIVDDYDKRVFDVKTESMPTLISEDTAITKGTTYNNVDRNDPNIDYCWASFGVVDFGDTYDYSYQINCKYKNNNSFPTTEVRATDGKVIRVYGNLSSTDLISKGTYKY